MRARSVPLLHATASAIAVSLCALGCTTEVGEGSGAAGGNMSPACSVTDVTGSIPGVSISIQSDHCIYKVGESAEFSYLVKTEETVPTIEIMAGMGCGSCTKPTADPLTFVSYVIGGTSTSGDPQTYCRCDVGCCPPEEAAMIKPQATTSAGMIQWSGRNWHGPSDTNNPEGDFFLPGMYEVTVTFNGRAQGSVTAKLPIEVTP